MKFGLTNAKKREYSTWSWLKDWWKNSILPRSCYLPPIPWHRAQQLALQSSNMAIWEIPDQLPSWNIKILLKNGEFSGVYYKLKPSIFCRVKLFAAGKWKGPATTCRKANAMESMAQNRWYDPVGSCWWFMACFNRPQQYIYIYMSKSQVRWKPNIIQHLFTSYFRLLWCSPGVSDYDSSHHIQMFSPRETQPKKRSPTETQLQKQSQKLLCITRILTESEWCLPQWWLLVYNPISLVISCYIPLINPSEIGVIKLCAPT